MAAEAESILPLHWESANGQLWFASPLDLAFATGRHDLIRRLLLSDPTLFLSLTSLRRLSRLHSLFSSAAPSFSSAARRLFLDCGPSLLASGHGPWLLFSAAAAADFPFAASLLRRRPLLVFGEGEYGLSHLLYAAAAGRHLPTFSLLLDCALKHSRERNFADEVAHRAVHAAARGGCWEIFRDVVRRFGDDVVAARDSGGATVVHSAASRGRVEVIEGIMMSYDIISDARDGKGNAAIHVAAFRGQTAAVETLIQVAPLCAYSKNGDGDTALHVAIKGFTAPGFRPLDCQLATVKALLAIDSGELVNEKNKQGRTPLHVAAAENVHADAMAMLTGTPAVNVYAIDAHGLTMFDLLRRRRRGGAELWRRVSRVGVECLKDAAARSALAAQIRESQTLTSPGTSFRVHDSEILLLAGVDRDHPDLSVDSTLEEETEEDEG